MSFLPYTSDFKKVMRVSGFEAACLLLGTPEPLPRFVHDLEALELIHGQAEEILDRGDLRPYQRWMVSTILKQDVFLGAEMGLGKTSACLLAVKQLIDAGEITQVLVVAPLRVAEETWPAEIAKWAFARDLTYRVVTGTEEERVAALGHKAQITIVNRENVRWLYERLGVRGWKFDMLIYDEASRLKSGRKRTKATTRADGTKSTKKLTELGVLRRVRFKFKRIAELSGTPSPNGLIDLWGPIYLIDQGERLMPSMTKFEERWFRPPRRGFSRSEPFDHSEKEIMGKISDIFYSLKEEDYLNLPPLLPVDHKVVLTPKEMALYRKFERENALEVVNNQGDPEVIKAVNNGVLTGKLLQFANGSLYLDDNSAKKIHEHKLDVLESIVTEAMGAPIICAYSFKFDMDVIKKRFPFVRIYGDSKNDMRDWNAGKIKFLLTHPASAGHGLNFQHGSNIMVWYGLSWSAELYQQFIKRLHRSGQKADRVFLHRIIAKGTVDETVLRVLANRKATQDDITDAVRVRLEKVAA